MSTKMFDERVAVIVGSTRPTRICPGIAAWTRQVLDETSPLHYALVDLAEVNLPFLDEPLKAALRDYRHDHTKAWSKLITGFAGFVFVLPQYNWGYPGVVKNALDYLYYEWHGKPATTVTYGTRGGGKAADQMRQVFDGLHMRALPGRVEVRIGDDAVDAEWQLTDLEATMTPHREQLRLIDEQMVEALEDSQAEPGASPLGGA
jgi:NAD(P)H-dependent FMN reductase